MDGHPHRPYRGAARIEPLNDASRFTTAKGLGHSASGAFLGRYRVPGS